MTEPVDATTEAALVRLAREESGHVLALLARRFDDLDLADDAVQDALVEASQVWPTRGIPTNPGGWLHAVARRKAIDRIRRSATHDRRIAAAAPVLIHDPNIDSEGEAMIDESNDARSSLGAPGGDEHLRLVLLCCHPALDIDTQIALTLRLVSGLTTAEIASAYLVPEATMAQRLVRAKRKIRDAGIPLSIPAAFDERVDAVLTVTYLIFNEGYLSRGATEGVMRVDLADEAVRLTRLVRTLLPDSAEVEGLLALELFHLARAASRADSSGELVLLEDQDRSTWDLPMIEQANAVLSSAMRRMAPGVYQLQAAIAAVHANARVAADTDWPTVVTLYRQLMQLSPSPVIALNHAVAVAMADGPNAGLVLLERIGAAGGLDRYHLFHAARGELLLRTGDRAAARVAFTTAQSLTANPAERRHLDRRIAASGGGG